MAKNRAKSISVEEKSLWKDRSESIEREVEAESALGEVKYVKRMKFDRQIPFDDTDPRVLKVNPDGTALVDTKGLCCVVIHNGDFDEDGVEVCIVYSDFCLIDYAMTHARSWNNSDRGRCIGFKKSAWAEVITYEEYFIRENGEKLPEKKAAPKPKRKPKVKLAKVG